MVKIAEVLSHVAQCSLRTWFLTHNCFLYLFCKKQLPWREFVHLTSSGFSTSWSLFFCTLNQTLGAMDSWNLLSQLFIHIWLRHLELFCKGHNLQSNYLVCNCGIQGSSRNWDVGHCPTCPLPLPRVGNGLLCYARLLASSCLATLSLTAAGPWATANRRGKDVTLRQAYSHTL